MSELHGLRLVDDRSGPRPGADARSPVADESEALDAYSRVVTDIVTRTLPAVASLRVTRHLRGGARADGAGSAVSVTPDGCLLTSAHVVEGSTPDTRPSGC